MLQEAEDKGEDNKIVDEDDKESEDEEEDPFKTDIKIDYTSG